MCPSHHHSIRIGDALITENMSSREIILNGSSKERQAVQQYNSNNSNSVNVKSHCECNNSNNSCKKLLYHKFKDNDNMDKDDVNINVLPSPCTCDSLNSLVVGRAETARRHGDDNVSISMSHSPSVSPTVSSSTINSCSGCGRLPTTTSPSPSDQDLNLDTTIRRSLYRTKDSYSSTNTSSNNSLHSTKSSASAAVNNNLDDSLTIISNNRDASIKLDELSQRSFSLSTSDNGILDEDLAIENPTNSAVAHTVEHEICDERKPKHSLVKKRHRASNHSGRSDSRRYQRSSSSSSSESSCNTIHSNYSHKSDTQRDMPPRTDVRSRQSGNRSPLKCSTPRRRFDCSNHPCNCQMDQDGPESALIPQSQTCGLGHCSHYAATSTCSCSTCHNRCGGCDKSIPHNKCRTSSSTELGDDDDDVDDEGPRQSLSLNTSSSSTSIPSSPPPLSVASKSSSISSIHSLSRQPQPDTHLISTSKQQSKTHIKAIL